MRFNLDAGQHKFVADFEPDGKGSFSGSISSPEYGVGKISGLITGDHYIGTATLDGHSAKFDATISGGEIKGTIKAGWFFSLTFFGKEAA